MNQTYQKPYTRSGAALSEAFLNRIMDATAAGAPRIEINALCSDYNNRFARAAGDARPGGADGACTAADYENALLLALENDPSAPAQQEKGQEDA